MSAIRKLDYLSFTLKDALSPVEIFQAFNLKFLELGYGRFGYRNCAIAESGGITVYWDGFKEDMGVHVQVSGQGCRLVEALENFPSWRTWIASWLESGAKFTRLDLAIDDEEATVDFETVHQAVANRTAVMRSKCTRYILDDSKGTSYRTLYVGRRTSDTMMRCYDKGMQSGQGRSWLRFEFEYKGERADAVAHLLAYHGWDTATGVCRSFIEFKDETHLTTDKTRQRAAAWWEQLVNASKHTLHLSRETHANLLKAYGWLKRQASSIIAVLLEHEGGDISWILDLAEEGKQKFKERHRVMLRYGLGTPSIVGATG